MEISTRTMSPPVSIIIAALLPKYGIGYKGGLPWKLKNEMKYFRQVTTKTRAAGKQNVVIMGRRTYESIPPKFRPLKGRLNYVLTRNLEEYTKEMQSELAEHSGSLKIAGSLDQVLKDLDPEQVEEVFIIGGAQLYHSAMDQVPCAIDRIFLTQVTSDKPVEMDTYFNMDTIKWQKTDKLGEYLESKGLKYDTENTEGDFQYEFTLWEPASR